LAQTHKKYINFVTNEYYTYWKIKTKTKMAVTVVSCVMMAKAENLNLGKKKYFYAISMK